MTGSPDFSGHLAASECTSGFISVLFPAQKFRVTMLRVILMLLN